MASITATTSTSSALRATLVCPTAHRLPFLRLLGLTTIAHKGGVRCSIEEKRPSHESTLGIGAASLMAASAWVTTVSSPAFALVDERMSTEGTGLPFGLSDNLLGWILFGVFGLIWSIYFIYTSTLEEDEDSGLSL